MEASTVYQTFTITVRPVVGTDGTVQLLVVVRGTQGDVLYNEVVTQAAITNTLRAIRNRIDTVAAGMTTLQNMLNNLATL